MPDVGRCGSCGNVFKVADDAQYNSLCGDCLVPHQLITRKHIGRDVWRCHYCGQEGTMAQLESTNCTHVYVPCKGCSEAPYCARDCKLIGAILSGNEVYVAGFPGPKDGH